MKHTLRRLVISCLTLASVVVLFVLNIHAQTQPNFIPVFPKYKVLGVVYAPPGSASSVTYGNSTLTGSASSLTTMNANTNVTSTSSTSGGFLGLFGGSTTQTWSDGWTTAKQAASSVAVNTTQGNSISTMGPISSALGVNHDNDVIYIWLNPVISTTVTTYNPNTTPPTLALNWTALSSNGCDLTDAASIGTFYQAASGCDPNQFPAPDIVGIPVWCLKNPYWPGQGCMQWLPYTQRSWDQSLWSNADGSTIPGLTMQDYADILQADPFEAVNGNAMNVCHPGYGPDLDPNDPESLAKNPTAPVSPQYNPAGTPQSCGGPLSMMRFQPYGTVEYPVPGPDGLPQTYTGKLQYQNTNTNATTAIDTHTTNYSKNTTISFGTSWGIAGFSIAGFNIATSNGTSNSQTWQQTNSITTTSTLTGEADYSITGPQLSDNYTGPATYNVYLDNVYGTYAFYSNLEPKPVLGTIGVSSPSPFGAVTVTVNPTTGLPTAWSAEQTVTLTNNSQYPLTMVAPAISFSDPGFQVAQNVLNDGSDNCSNQLLQPAGTCQIGVVFAPVVSDAPNTIVANTFRIQTSGGTTAYKYYSGSTLSQNGAAYTLQATVRNNGTAIAQVNSNFNSVNIAPGTTQNVVLNFTGNGTSNPQFLLQTVTNISDPIDVTVWNPYVAKVSDGINLVSPLNLSSSGWSTGTGATVTITSVAPISGVTQYPVNATMIAAGTENVQSYENILVTSQMAVTGTASVGATTQGATLRSATIPDATQPNAYVFAQSTYVAQTQQYTFKNYYSSNVTFPASPNDIVLTDAVDFSVLNDTVTGGCSAAVVAPGGTCTFTLQYLPASVPPSTGLFATRITAMGTVNWPSGSTGVIPLTFAGAAGTAQLPLTFSPTSLNFSFPASKQIQELPLTFTNHTAYTINTLAPVPIYDHPYYDMGGWMGPPIGAGTCPTIGNGWAANLGPGASCITNSTTEAIYWLTYTFGETGTWTGTLYFSGTLNNAAATPIMVGIPFTATVTAGASKITLSGSEQSTTKTTPAKAGKATVTLSGSVKTAFTGLHHVSLTVGTFKATASYDQTDTSQSVAKLLATALNVSGSPVKATVSGDSVTVTNKKAGAAGNIAYAATNNKDFAIGPRTGSLTGGADAVTTTIYDGGSVAASVGSVSATATWGKESTPQKIAGRLAASLTTAANGAFTASASGGIITITSKTPSSLSPLTVQVNDSMGFSPASYAGTTGN